MTKTYTHFSTEPINTLVDRRQNGVFKPKGLWVSDETDHGWSQWCSDERFNLNDAYVYDVTLDTTNMLLIDNDKALLEFAHEYHTRGEPFRGIHWGKVADDYEGIIISPYSWTLRLDLTWYYGWDCASGCIWDACAVTNIDLTSKGVDTKELQC